MTTTTTFCLTSNLYHKCFFSFFFIHETVESIYSSLKKKKSACFVSLQVLVLVCVSPAFGPTGEQPSLFGFIALWKEVLWLNAGSSVWVSRRQNNMTSKVKLGNFGRTATSLNGLQELSSARCQLWFGHWACDCATRSWLRHTPTHTRTHTHTPPKSRTNSLSQCKEVRKEPSVPTQRVGHLWSESAVFRLWVGGFFFAALRSRVELNLLLASFPHTLGWNKQKNMSTCELKLPYSTHFHFVFMPDFSRAALKWSIIPKSLSRRPEKQQYLAFCSQSPAKKNVGCDLGEVSMISQTVCFTADFLEGGARNRSKGWTFWQDRDTDYR